MDISWIWPNHHWCRICMGHVIYWQCKGKNRYCIYSWSDLDYELKYIALKLLPWNLHVGIYFIEQHGRILGRLSSRDQILSLPSLFSSLAADPMLFLFIRIWGGALYLYGVEFSSIEGSCMQGMGQGCMKAWCRMHWCMNPPLWKGWVRALGHAAASTLPLWSKNGSTAVLETGGGGFSTHSPMFLQCPAQLPRLRNCP